MVWYGLVWLETTSIKSFYENFIKIQLVLAVLEKIYTWYSLVRFGLVWYGLVWFETTPIQGYYESFIKIQRVLAVLEKNVSWFSLVRFGFVWFGLVWDNIHRKLLWKFHQNPTCFERFREDLKLGWGGVVFSNNLA